MQRADLPEELRSGPFRTRDAFRRGVAASRLRAHDLDRRVWGVRRADGADDLRGLVEAFARRLRPDAFFSHTTAARLLDIPVPIRLEREPRIHVSVPAPARAPHASGIIGHRLSGTTVVVHRGIRVSSPVDVWRDLAPVLSLTELVAAGDRIIHHRSRLATRREIEVTVAAAGPMRGTVNMRAALPFLDERAESPPESELRVLLALADLPRPEVNHVVVETEIGHDVRIDLTYRRLKFAIEYQGDYHRSRRQWRKDMTRRTRLESQGWYVMEVNADDLRDPAELVARIRAIMARRT